MKEVSIFFIAVVGVVGLYIFAVVSAHHQDIAILQTIVQCDAVYDDEKVIKECGFVAKQTALPFSKIVK